MLGFPYLKKENHIWRGELLMIAVADPGAGKLGQVARLQHPIY
jgi:hypothetical protein